MIDMFDPDEYWEGFTDEAFLEYLEALPEPNEHDPYDIEYGNEPWPTSIERRSYFYDGGSY